MAATALDRLPHRRRVRGAAMLEWALAVFAGLFGASALMWVVMLIFGVSPLRLLGPQFSVQATALPGILQLGTSVAAGSTGPVCAHPGPAPITAVPLGIRLVSALGILLEAIGVVLGLTAGQRVVAGIAAGQPFGRRVLTSLRTFGIALLAGALLRSATHAAAIAWIGSWFSTLDRVHDPCLPNALGVGDLLHVSWPLVTAGLVALALLAAFRTGAKLEEDAVGVV